MHSRVDYLVVWLLERSVECFSVVVLQPVLRFSFQRKTARHILAFAPMHKGMAGNLPGNALGCGCGLPFSFFWFFGCFCGYFQFIALCLGAIRQPVS
jgi:hypothetical protein